jgi:Zn finger protein HypA/HybF involved in hydrogenase expression
VHLGQVATACETCHAVHGEKFKAVNFSHARSAFALTGKHETTACVKCHKTETRAFATGHGKAMVLKPMDFRCQACHADVHLGQVDLKCETCHQTAAFKLSTYTHKGLEAFFAGFHGKYACVACHKSETGAFPAGRGTAMRFMVGTTCIACHPR